MPLDQRTKHSDELNEMPKKFVISFREASSPITEPQTKFGGQPNWILEPQWPLSRETGNPMRFVCQIRLAKELFPEVAAEMAYLFMTDEEGEDAFVDGTYEPDGGENAVILQPGVPAVPTTRLSDGPTLYRMVPRPGQNRLQPESCEFAVELNVGDDIPFLPEEERWKQPDADVAQLNENKVGGTPVFLQGDDFPFGGSSRLLLQLDSCSVPFSINFGDAGVGYAFLNDTGDQAKFLWQCG